MTLSGKQTEQLHAALLQAFDSRPKLSMMLAFKLDRNLDEIALGENMSEIVFKLIECAKSGNWTDELIMGAYQQAPKNILLRNYYYNFFPALAVSREPEARAARRLPQPCNFDLTLLIEETLDLVDGKQGLLGLSIPCDVHIFLNNYCQRLKNVMDRRKTQIRPILTLKPTNVSIDEAIEMIKRSKLTLGANDVLCPIVFQIAESGLANLFWQQLCQEFQDTYANRLILILGGDTTTTFPDAIMPLTSPKFKPSHVFTWIGDVVEQLDWPHDVREIWKQRMLAECSYKNELHIQFVYEHLDYTIQLLQENPPCESFLEELERRCYI